MLSPIKTPYILLETSVYISQKLFALRLEIRGLQQDDLWVTKKHHQTETILEPPPIHLETQLLKRKPKRPSLQTGVMHRAYTPVYEAVILQETFVNTLGKLWIRNTEDPKLFQTIF